MSRYYKWELAILASGRDVDRQRLEDLRHRFEIRSLDYKMHQEKAPELADEILQIAREASTKRGWLDEPTEQ